MALAARGRVDEVFENYLLALAGADQCPDSASMETRQKLAANVERAERAFADAVADGLHGSSAALAQAVRDLADANEVSRVGFHNGRPIGDLLADLEQATGRAQVVLRVADD